MRSYGKLDQVFFGRIQQFIKAVKAKMKDNRSKCEKFETNYREDPHFKDEIIEKL